MFCDAVAVKMEMRYRSNQSQRPLWLSSSDSDGSHILVVARHQNNLSGAKY